ncbi:MAG: hypothetical protein JW908_12450 [Anaerolineales bacterium]|nr:hypothetical protein [Anaerolineales bacterium]
MIDLVTFTTNPAAGGDGAASATGYSPPVFGKLLSVNVQYNDDPPATADIALYDEGDPAQELLVFKSNNNSDFRCYPRRPVQSNYDVDLTYDGSRKICDHYIVHGRLKGVLSGANDGDMITFMAWLER